MLDFFNLNEAGQHTSVKIILLALVLTFVLSIILVLVYEYTSRQVSKSDHFLQSLMLMSIVTATIMQSIGDSLALSFGIFGALAIIRFRTNISDPRDVAFIFASMAIGIACGVHSFLNAILGTLAFGLIAFFIRLSPYGRKEKLIAEVRVELPYQNSNKAIEEALKQYKMRAALKRTRYIVVEGSQKIEYEYQIMLDNIQDTSSMIDKLNSIEEGKVTRFNFQDENLQSDN